MTVRVAMYDKSLAHIGKQLDALGLDIAVMPFSKDGKFHVQGAALSPAEVDIDYFWLSSHIAADNFRDGAFGLALDCRSIKVLQTFNAGLDAPVYKKLSDKGVRICNSSAQGVAIAEYVMAQVLAVLQPIERQRQLQRSRTWEQTPFRELSQTNWLIVGFGPIGQEVAVRVKAFGAATAVVRRTPQPTPLADRIGTMADLTAFAAEADVVVLACPLNNDTRNIADAKFFAALKPGAILVNIARGGLVDDAALLAALGQGRVATAIIDVFRSEPLPPDDPFWDHPQVRLTSHTSFAGSGGRGRWDRLFLDNIQRFVRGEPLMQEVRPADVG